MAIGVKFVDVIPSSVENAVEVKKGDVKNYLFVGIPMSEFIGKKYEYEGFIYMCLQGVTLGERMSNGVRDVNAIISIAVLRPVRPATGQASYHLVSYTPLTYTRSDVAILLRNGDFKVVKRDDCNLI